mmetsp:Transcript_23232/g.63855  ORF Transcript_23232/g.63855 Transcript_23232/m.63855 type:complete len:174 (+) Transcript_23232:879-1400(+)
MRRVDPSVPEPLASLQRSCGPSHRLTCSEPPLVSPRPCSVLLTHLVSRPLLILTPALSRSQFAMPEDLRGLIDPPKLISDRPKLLAGPIFTSVPPLRADSRFGGRKGNGPLGGSAAHLGWGDLIEEHEARCRPIHAVPEPLCSARVSTIHMPTCGSNAFMSRSPSLGITPPCP